MKICLVCSSGGHLQHLYLLRKFWSKHERFWVTFDKEDTRSILVNETIFSSCCPTNRSIKALVLNTVLAWKVLHKEKLDIIIGCCRCSTLFLSRENLRDKNHIYRSIRQDRQAYSDRQTCLSRCRQIRRAVGGNEKILSKSRKSGKYLLTEKCMIFVTVGTHEQPFDRLIQCIDRLAEEKIIQDEFVVQTGFSRYIPKFCEYRQFFTCNEMAEFTQKARIIITHGGPSSFIPVLEENKIPIVIPRRKKFGEHINDHQFDFVSHFYQMQKNIIFAENDDDIREDILHYDDIIKDMPKRFLSNNAVFTEHIERLAMELLK